MTRDIDRAAGVAESPAASFDARYRAVSSRDPRFDGYFVTAVRSTKIYCRPSCPARTPNPQNVAFYATAAQARGAGYRACLRCRPDAVPGTPEWNGRADVAARAMRLIRDGTVDRAGVAGLARAVGVSERQLNRTLLADVGVGPTALARAQRTDIARVLIETTTMGFTDVAFAAGFASVRQFNDTIREVYNATPTQLRARRSPSSANAGNVLLRLPFRAPMAVADMLGFLGSRALTGIETYENGVYRRTLRLPNGHGIAALSDGGSHVVLKLQLESMRDLAPAVARIRRQLDLDADPSRIDGLLGSDPLLAASVAADPGRRVPGAVDGTEIVVRAIVGQQVSVAGARTVIARCIAALDARLRIADAALTHVFPTAAELAASGLVFLPMPGARRAALRSVMAAIAAGEIDVDAGADSRATCRDLLAMPGIGPWTVAYVAMRALGDTDAFLAGDLGVRRAFESHGLAGDARSAERHSEAWRPWRAYALQHLWRPGSRDTKEENR